MRTLQAKGINFRSFVAALRKVKGDAALERTCALLPPEIGEALRLGAFTTSAWYPCEQYSKLHSAMQQACGGGLELSRLIARESVKIDFESGVYRLITFTLAPEALFKLAQRVMSLYWDGGKVVVEQAEVGRAMGRFEAFHGFDRNLWEDVIGGSLGILDVGGAKAPTVRVLAGGGDGDSHMTYLVRWT